MYSLFTNAHINCIQQYITPGIVSNPFWHYPLYHMNTIMSTCVHSFRRVALLACAHLTHGLSRMAGESNPVSCYAHRISSAAVHRSHRHPFNYQTTICYHCSHACIESFIITPAEILFQHFVSVASAIIPAFILHSWVQSERDWIEQSRPTG